MASKRAVVGVVLAAVLLLAGRAGAAEVPINFGVGDLTLQPGMVLHLIRHQGNRNVVVGRMKVIQIAGGSVQLQLLSGTAAMQDGDQIEVEPHKPRKH